MRARERLARGGGWDSTRGEDAVRAPRLSCAAWSCQPSAYGKHTHRLLGHRRRDPLEVPKEWTGQPPEPLKTATICQAIVALGHLGLIMMFL